MVMNLTFGLFLTVIGMSRCFTTSELDQDRTRGLPHIPEHRPPVKFYRQLGNDIRCNSGSYFVHEEETKRMSGEFVQHVRTENSNSHSVGGEFGVGFSIFSASVNYQYEVSHSSETETETSRSFENYFSRVTEREYTIGEDECMILAAEMQMVVFKLKNGQRKRMIVPTGKSLTGIFTADQLISKDLLLDDSFEMINRLTGSLMKTYNHDQIQQSMEKNNLITRMPALSERRVETTASKPQVSYIIKNVPYMAYSLKRTNNKVRCTADATDNILWKFKEVRHKTGEYYIQSGRYRLMDLGDYKWAAGYKRRDDPNQHWKIDFVDPSTVTITNVKTGAKLAQWGQWRKCGPVDRYECEKYGCAGITDENYHWNLIPTEPQKNGRRTGGHGASGGRNGNNGRGTSGRWNGNHGRGSSGRGQGNSGGGGKNWIEWPSPNAGKCGPGTRGPNGGEAGCNPSTPKYACCSQYGWCNPC